MCGRVTSVVDERKPVTHDKGFAFGCNDVRRRGSGKKHKKRYSVPDECSECPREEGREASFCMSHKMFVDTEGTKCLVVTNAGASDHAGEYTVVGTIIN